MVVDDKKRTRERTYPSFAEGYKLLECVGRGSEGSVWRAMCIPNKKEVAIKIIDLDCLPTSALEELREQVHLMYSCSMHPHIVRYYTSFVNCQSLWCVMRFLSGGSCSDIMKLGHAKGLDEAAIKIILKDTLKALEYFHANGRIHRDIKAGNIVISARGCVQVADFGVSGSMIEQLRTTLCGSPCWMAPEVMLRAFPKEGDDQPAGYDSSVDIWSLGITALELAKGRPPLAELAPSRVFSMVTQNPPPSLVDGASSDKRRFSHQFKDFISLCLQKDPSKRPTAAKLLKHKFFKGKKSRDYLVSTVLAPLPPLKERAGMMSVNQTPPAMVPSGPSASIPWIFDEEYFTSTSSFESTSTNFLSTSTVESQNLGNNLSDDASSYSDSSFFDDWFAAPTPSNTMTDLADADDVFEDFEECCSRLERDCCTNV